MASRSKVRTITLTKRKLIAFVATAIILGSILSPFPRAEAITITMSGIPSSVQRSAESTTLTFSLQIAVIAGERVPVNQIKIVLDENTNVANTFTFDPQANILLSNARYESVTLGAPLPSQDPGTLTATGLYAIVSSNLITVSGIGTGTGTGSGFTGPVTLTYNVILRLFELTAGPHTVRALAETSLSPASVFISESTTFTITDQTPAPPPVVESVPSGTNVSVQPPGTGVSLTFSEVPQPTSVIVEQIPVLSLPALVQIDTQGRPAVQAGGQSRVGVGTVFNINVVGQVTGTTTINLPYDQNAIPAGVSEQNVRILRFTNGAWVELPGSVNSVENTVSAQVSGFSPFMPGSPGSPGQSSAGTRGGGGGYAGPRAGIDILPPKILTISHDPTAPEIEQAISVSANVIDPLRPDVPQARGLIQAVYLRYVENGTPLTQYKEIEMSRTISDEWEAKIPSEDVQSAGIVYWIHAVDRAKNSADTETYTILIGPTTPASAKASIELSGERWSVAAGEKLPLNFKVSNLDQVPLSGSLKLLINGKDVRETSSGIINPNESKSFTLEWKTDKRTVDTSILYDAKVVGDFDFGSKLESNEVQIAVYQPSIVKKLTHSNAIKIEPLKSKDSNNLEKTVAGPKLLSSILILPISVSDFSSINMKLSAPDETCVIGQEEGCLVKSSSEGMETLNVGDSKIKVRYTGPDVRFERFMIMAEEDDFLPEGEWKLELTNLSLKFKASYKLTYLGTDNLIL